MIDVTPEIQTASETVRVFEHQRKIPFGSFGALLLPGDPPGWVDEMGRSLGSDAVRSMSPGNGWKWVSTWRNGRGEASVDAEGWSYAVRFSAPHADWVRSKKSARVRRRIWQRKRRRTSSAEEATRLLKAGFAEADRQRRELHTKHATEGRGPRATMISGQRREQQECTLKRQSKHSKMSTDTVVVENRRPSIERVSPLDRSARHASPVRGNTTLEQSVLGQSVVLPRMIVDDIADAVSALQKNASVRASEGKWLEAIECLDQAIAADGRRPDLFAARSRALCVIGQYARALTDANYCVAVADAEFKDGHCCKGQALLHMRQYERAAKSFRTALRCDPDDDVAKNGLEEALSMKESAPETMKRTTRSVHSVMDEKNNISARNESNDD